jgi:hypothetical protein
MSSNGKPKETTQINFTISFDEDSPLPGVTQLLNPAAMKERALRTPQKMSTPPSMKSAPLPEKVEATPIHTAKALATTKTLVDLKVQFELRFEMKNGLYQYSKMKAHSKANLSLWQENFYYQMKINLKTFDIQKTFEEFEKGKHHFQEDAFGLSQCSHVQVVRLASQSDKLFVLLSEQSLTKFEPLIRELLEKNNSSSSGSNGDDFKIELVI